MVPLRILIAEDDKVIAMYLAQILLGMGHEICALTRDQAETVAAAALHAPDLMIVDEELSEGSGILAVTEILKAGFVRHIFATGDFYRVLKAEPQAIVLQKPFNIKALTRAIERARFSLSNGSSDASISAVVRDHSPSALNRTGFAGGSNS
jgi:DNA-binding response OmpR family regulator